MAGVFRFAVQALINLTLTKNWANFAQSGAPRV
jgi:hypothetical protein